MLCRSGTAIEASRIRSIRTRQRSCPPVADIRATGPRERHSRQRLVSPGCEHRFLNLRSAHPDQQEDQERAGHDGDQVGQEKKTCSAHDFQVQAAAQTETHRAERWHQCYGDSDSGKGRHAIAPSAANHDRTRQTGQQRNPQVEQIGIRSSDDFRRSGMKRQQPNQETRKHDGYRDAGEKVEYCFDPQVKIAHG